MNFFVVTHEIREINEQGVKNKLRGARNNHKKNVPPVYF